MRRLFPPQLASAFLIALGASGLLAGCEGEAPKDSAAATAQEALGVTEGNEHVKTVESTRDVTVVKDTKVIDNKTGEVLSKKTEATPVTISKEKDVKTDVDVKVGDTQATVK